MGGSYTKSHTLVDSSHDIAVCCKAVVYALLIYTSILHRLLMLKIVLFE